MIKTLPESRPLKRCAFALMLYIYKIYALHVQLKDLKQWSEWIITWDVFVFSDINECVSNTHKCSHHAECFNTHGSYKCKCKQGFRGSGFDCSGERLNQTRKLWISQIICIMYGFIWLLLVELHTTSDELRAVCFLKTLNTSMLEIIFVEYKSKI